MAQERETEAIIIYHIMVNGGHLLVLILQLPLGVDSLALMMIYVQVGMTQNKEGFLYAA